MKLKVIILNETPSSKYSKKVVDYHFEYTAAAYNYVVSCSV